MIKCWLCDAKQKKHPSFFLSNPPPRVKTCGDQSDGRQRFRCQSPPPSDVVLQVESTAWWLTATWPTTPCRACFLLRNTRSASTLSGAVRRAKWLAPPSSQVGVDKGALLGTNALNERRAGVQPNKLHLRLSDNEGRRLLCSLWLYGINGGMTAEQCHRSQSQMFWCSCRIFFSVMRYFFYSTYITFFVDDYRKNNSCVWPPQLKVWIRLLSADSEATPIFRPFFSVRADQG